MKTQSNSTRLRTAHRLTFQGIFVVVAAVILTGCSGDGPDEVSGQSVDMSGVEQRSERVVNPIAGNGLDVSYASDLFFAGVVVHPQKVFQSKVVSAEDLELLMSEWTAKTGLPLASCKQALILVPAMFSQEQAPAPVVLLEFDEPVDLASGLSDADVPMQSKTVGGTEMFLDPKDGIAAFQRDEVRIVVGGKAFVEGFAGGQLPRLGRLAELLGELDLDSDMEGVVNTAAMESMLPPGADAGSAPSEMFFKLSLTDDSMATMTFDAASDDDAKEFKSQVEQSVSAFRMLGPMLIQTATADSSAQDRNALSNFMKELLNGIAVETDNSHVKVEVAKPNSLPQAIAAMSAIMKKEQAWSAREARIEKVSSAMLAYHNENKMYPKPGSASQEGESSKLSWRVQILPQLGYQELYDEFHHDEPWDSEHNQTLLDKMPDEYQLREGATETSLSMLEGPDTALRHDVDVDHAYIADGRTKTLMLIDRGPTQVSPWTKPDAWVYQPAEPLPVFGDETERFFLASLFDGTVHRVPRKTSESDLRGMITPAGKETVNVDRVLGLEKPTPSFGGGFPF